MRDERVRKVCIYCLRTGDEIDFDREHIIPQAVGGNLYVDDMVCKTCNSTLGREVDCEILKVPDVLRAMDELGLPYDRDGVLRSYYETHLISESGRFRARPQAGSLALVVQDLPDGSRISPDHSGFERELRKTLLRDGTLEKAGIPVEELDRLLADLANRLKNAAIDEPVECPELGLTVFKRSDPMSAEIQPKKQPNLRRFVAKAAFEWFFFCLGKRFVESAPWAEDLHDLVFGDAQVKTIYVFRSQPPETCYRRIHQLYFIIHPGFSKVVLRLFGGIEYTLIAPPMDAAALAEFQGKVEGIFGVAFQQNLEDGSKSFFGLKSDDTPVLLASP